MAADVEEKFGGSGQDIVTKPFAKAEGKSGSSIGIYLGASFIRLDFLPNISTHKAWMKATIMRGQTSQIGMVLNEFAYA